MTGVLLPATVSDLEWWCRRVWPQMEWRYHAATHIQSAWKGYVVRRDLWWMNHYAAVLQRLWRRWYAQKDMMVRLFTIAQRKRYKDVITVQKTGTARALRVLHKGGGSRCWCNAPVRCCGRLFLSTMV